MRPKGSPVEDHAWKTQTLMRCNPIGAARISNEGFLPMTRDQYLALLDTLGRVVRAGKRGFIPADLPPILNGSTLSHKLGWTPFWISSAVGRIRDLLQQPSDRAKLSSIVEHFIA